MLDKLIRYTEVADSLYIEAFLKAKNTVSKAEELFSHLLNAQHVWISRINGISPRHLSFDVHEKSYFLELHIENIAALRHILTINELEKVIQYKTFAGEPLENAIADILLHVANHSTYHRAQVASLLKQNNIQPPVTDFIALKRMGLL